MAAPFSLANLVHEQSTTTGTGNFTLSQISGKQTFSAAFGTGTTTDIFEYFISNEVANEWEHGTGHMSDSVTLVRDTIWDSSNSGSAVSFSSGTKDVTQAISAQALWAPRGTIDGMVCSNDSGTPNTKLDVAAGLCRDDTDALCIRFTSSKTIDCTTTGANGLDTGSLAASTWYYVFAIGKRDGSAQAALASTSASTPTLPSGYAYKRRIGAFRTDGSSHILAFAQVGDRFYWAAPFVDVNVTNLGTSRTLYTLTVPPVTGIQAFIYGNGFCSSAANIWLGNPAATDAAPSLTASPGTLLFTFSVNTSMAFGSMLVDVNSSGQIAARSDTANSGLRIYTQGWVDQRGKNA
jgi:hypothetical protein